jgi:hypothetical protein
MDIFERGHVMNRLGDKIPRYSKHLTLSDPTSHVIRHYDFSVPLQCRKTSDTFFVALFARPAVGACPTLYLM